MNTPTPHNHSSSQPKDIEPGRCVMAQRCTRVNTTTKQHINHNHIITPPHNQKDIEPGRCVMAQRCTRVNTIEDMFKGMRGQPFAVEMKFDGYRLQV